MESVWLCEVVPCYQRCNHWIEQQEQTNELIAAECSNWESFSMASRLGRTIFNSMYEFGHTINSGAEVFLADLTWSLANQILHITEEKRKPQSQCWTHKHGQNRLTRKKTCEDATHIRHSTLLPWLQNGQEKTVSSLSIRFFGGGLAADFLFPMVQLLFFLQNQSRAMIKN